MLCMLSSCAAARAPAACIFRRSASSCTNDLLKRLPSVKDIVRLHQIRAEKSLSQNFLFSTKIAGQFIRSMKSKNPDFSNDLVFEIGPGPGIITRSLLQHNAKNVIVVERDRRFLPILQQLAETVPGSMHVVHGDALDFGLNEALKYRKTDSQKIYMVGNLPFSVASPLFAKYMYEMAQYPNALNALSLLFQLEVAQRINAKVSTEHRTRISVLREAICDSVLALHVPSRFFHPPPKVQTALVRVYPRKIPPVVKNKSDLRLLDILSTACFMHKQKSIYNNLRHWFPIEVVEKALEVFKLDPQSRPYDMHADQYHELAQFLKNAGCLTESWSDLRNQFSTLREEKKNKNRERSSAE